MVNLITEIPKMSKAKMEVNTKEENNPIAQDIKKGKLRDYHGPIFWNYGCVPQTWENVKEEHPVLKCFGDDDPVDVVEIGTAALAMGSVTPVKPLGVRRIGCQQAVPSPARPHCQPSQSTTLDHVTTHSTHSIPHQVLAMIDDGELDWKVVAIAASDPMADELNDIDDVEAKMPGTLSGIREWFRWYKTPDDKPLNAFGFDEKFLDKEEAMKVTCEPDAHHPYPPPFATSSYSRRPAALLLPGDR